MDVFEAAAQNNVDQLALLLERKRERKHINDRNAAGETPVFVACRNGHVEAARMIINAGADVNIQANDGSTPLHRACQSCRLDMLELLLGHNAQINKAMLDGATPLFVASAVGFESGVRRLLAARASVTAALDMTIENQKIISAQTGHDTLVRALVAVRRELHNDMTVGMTPLFVACQNGYEGVVRALLEAGSDPNQVESHGVSPIYAVRLLQ